jgi:ABC-type uncharacterized transport system substrate-binding protein
MAFTPRSADRRSLAHPGANMTGIAAEAALEINGKRLHILKEIVPGLNRAAVLRDVDTRSWGFEWTALDQAARELRLSLVPVDIKSAEELERPTSFVAGLAVAGARLAVQSRPKGGCHDEFRVARARRAPAGAPF